MDSMPLEMYCASAWREDMVSREDEGVHTVIHE